MIKTISGLQYTSLLSRLPPQGSTHSFRKIKHILQQLEPDKYSYGNSSWNF